jgi:hypothetical protein
MKMMFSSKTVIALQVFFLITMLIAHRAMMSMSVTETFAPLFPTVIILRALLIVSVKMVTKVTPQIPPLVQMLMSVKMKIFATITHLA